MILNEGKVYIRHIEKERGKAEKIHVFEKKPILLQLAPYPKNSQRIIRAHFKGTAPTWLNHFDKNYSVIRTTGEYGTGFAIVTRISDGILMSPIIKGQLNELLDDANFKEPLERERLKERLKVNFEIVEKNIKYYPELLEDFDIYYRNESVTGKTATLYRGSQWKEHNEENEAKWNALFEMLFTMREYPEELEEISEPEEVEELEEISEPEEIEELEGISEPEEIEELEEISEPEEVEELEEISEPEEIEELEEISEPEEIEELREISEPEEIEALEGISEPEEIEELEEISEPEETEKNIVSPNVEQLEIVQKTNKREKVLAGQILLF